MSASGSGAGRGIFLCVAIVLFGALIVGGMYLAPRAQSPQAPLTAQALPPNRKVKFVSLDLRRRHLASTPIVAALKELDADFVCLQDVESDDVVPLAEALGMTRSFHMELFAASQNLDGKHASFGNCVLARGEIDAGAAIVGPKGSLGAWGVAVIGGNKFRVASIHLSSGSDREGELDALAAAWKSPDQMPIVIAGLFGSAVGATDLVNRETGWFDALSPFAQVSDASALGVPPDDRILFSPGWASIAGGIAPRIADSAAPVWVIGTSMHSAMPATTHPVSPAGEEP